MTIETMDTFLELCRLQSFTEAAYACNMTQSALSKQIRKLEEELNLDLIVRNGKKFALTDAGRIFQAYARQATHMHREMLRKLSPGEIRIGSMPVLAPYHFAKLVAAFDQVCPHQKILLDERPTKELLTHREEYDFLLLRSCLIDEPSRYQFLPLYDDVLCAVVPLSHPLAHRDSVSLTELRDESFILPTTGTGGREFCLESCHRAGFLPHILYEFPQANTIFSFVEEGLGITLTFTRIYEELRHEKLCMLPLREKFHYPIALVYSREKKLTGDRAQFIKYITARSPQLSVQNH